MSKIPAAKAAALFEEIIGWPYELGGSGKEDGGNIDCSGAWVRVYRKYGKSIYHGSNRQYREYCSRTGTITGPADLRVGMVVFKCKEWAEDQRGHRDYGTAPGNIYHVGCVTSVNPLRIVHATPPKAKPDTSIGTGARRWQYWGLLKEVEYDAAAPTPPDDTPALWTATVTTERDPLRIRASAPEGAILGHAPRGATVNVLDAPAPEGWVYGRYGGVTGYLSRQYLTPTEAHAPEPRGYTVRVLAYEGDPLTVQQASNIAEEMRVAGYDVEITGE